MPGANIVQDDLQSRPPVYLDTASFGLMAPRTVAAAQKFAQDAGSGLMNTAALAELVESTRRAVKDYLEMGEGSLSFTPPFGQALLQIAAQLPPQKVLVLSDDYPSIQTVWRDAGHHVQLYEQVPGAPIAYERLFENIRQDKVNILTISHVNYRSGRIADTERLDRFCAQHKVLLIIDATQSLGLVPITLSQAPSYILLASSYKWLCAGYGLGIRYVSPASYLLLKTMGYAANNSDSAPEISHYNYDAIVRLKAALANRPATGSSDIYGQVSSLVKRFLAGLDCALNNLITAPENIRAGIISIEEREGLYEAFVAADIRVAQRTGIIRIAPHWYNTAAEMDRALSVVNQAQ